MSEEISRQRAYLQAKRIAEENARASVSGIRYTLGGVEHTCRVLLADINDAMLLGNCITCFSNPPFPCGEEITSELLHSVRGQALDAAVGDGRLKAEDAAFPKGTWEIRVQGREGKAVTRWLPEKTLLETRKLRDYIQNILIYESVTPAAVLAARQSARKLS